MIIDANVAVKWVINHPDSERARSLPRIGPVAAPSSLMLEAAHALTREKRERRLKPDQVRAGYQLIVSALRFVDVAELVSDALELSLALHANVYDCAYLALAMREDDVLVTADARFLTAVRKNKAHARYVKALAEA